MTPITETIELKLSDAGVKSNSLAGLIAELKLVDAWATKADAALNGLGTKPGASARTAQQMENILAPVKNALNQAKILKAQQDEVIRTYNAQTKKFEKQQVKKGDILRADPRYPLPGVAKALQMDAKAWENWLAGQKKVEGYVKSARTFNSPQTAAAAAAAYEKVIYKNIGKSGVHPADYLRPTVSQVTGGTVSGGNIKIDGKVDFTIPGTMINPILDGKISLVLKPTDFAATVPPGTAPANNAPGSGEFVKGNKAGKKRKSDTVDSTAARMKIPDKNRVGQIATSVTAQGKEIKETVTRINEVGQLVNETWSNIEQGLVKSVTKTKTGQTALAQFRALRLAEDAKFAQLKLENKGGDEFGFGLASVQAKQAAQLRAMLPKELAASLGPVGAASVQSQLAIAADTLDAQSKATRADAIAAMNASAEKRVRNIEKGWFQQLHGTVLPPLSGLSAGQIGAQMLARWASTPPNAAGMREDFNRPYPVPALRPRAGRLGGWRDPNIIDVESWPVGEPPPPKTPKPQKPPPKTPMQKALEGFTPYGFATHLVKVAGWAAAVGVLYKSLQLVEYSMKRVLDVGNQMAHLQVIYTGIGGSVRQLTDDLMKQASVQGRSTDDAMESGQEWARILKSRSQVNEAVRVSMMAANISGLPDSETTKQLSSLFHIFHLEVSGLESELSKLVYVSQHYNVTLEDLFKGLDAAAPQARMMGMSLAELSGIIAGTVGKSGQSGTTVGNTIKYILQQFNRPQIQRMLREYGIEPTAASGKLKKAPQLMRELFVQYQGLGDTERQSLTTQLAGRFHGSRFTATMDSYIQSQGLAINSQLALNSAQTANAAILDTLQNKLAGLKAEWDRFVFSQTNAPSAALGGFTPMNLMTGTVGAITGGMRALDQANESLVTPMGVGALFGGGAIGRHILGSLMEKEAATKAGSSFLLNLARRFGLGGAMKLLGGRAASWLLGPEVGLPVMAATFMPAIGTMLGSWSGGGGGLDPSQWFRGDAWTKVSNIMGGRASASALKANLFQTTSDLLGIKNPDKTAQGNIAAAVNLSGTEMSAADAATLNKLFAGGDMAGVTTLLGQQGKAASAQSLDDLKNKAIADKNKVASMNQEIARDQARVDEPVTWKTYSNAMGMGTSSYQTGGMKDADRQKLIDHIEDEKKALEQLAETASDSQEILDEVQGLPPDAIERRQEYISLLKQEEEMLTQIGKVASMGSPGTATDQLNTQIAAAKLQAETATDYYNGIVGYMKEHPEKDMEMAPIKEEALQRMQQYGAQADALDTDGRKASAREETDRGIVLSRADLEASASAYGYTDTAKMLNEKKFLTDDLAATAKNPNASQNDLLRAKELQIKLGETQNSLDERRIVLLGQQHQIMIDSNREYQKSLLFAGPGELLQKLYVAARAGKGPISAGEFMSWDPESRKTYYDMRGGDAGAKNREELALLKQNALNEYQGALKSYMAHPSAAGRSSVTDAWKKYQSGGLSTVAGQQADSHANSAAVSDWMAKMMQTTTSIGLMGGAADLVTGALKRLEDKLKSITGTKTSPSPTPTKKSFDLSPGHALGSQMPLPASRNDPMWDAVFQHNMAMMNH